MKKILSLFMILVGVFALVACTPEIREQDPEIRGVVALVEVDVNANFDPLEGITAFESAAQGAKEITDQLTTTFNPEWLTKSGEYRYQISVTNSNDRTKTENVTIIVGQSSRIILEAPQAVTYYIGSKPFDPLEEVKAYDELTGEEVEVTIADENYSLVIPGRSYSYTISTIDETGTVNEQVISLAVEPKVDILTELPKGQEIKINMWHSNGSTIENALEKYGKSFEVEMAALGYNIKVDIIKNGSNYDELRTNVVNALKGGALPNIVQNYPDHVVEYNQNNVIEPLTPYIYHPTHGYNEEDSQEKFTDILYSYRAEQRATNAFGNYISLPFNKSTEVVAYNKTLFDTVLRGRPFPETWQELFDLRDDIFGVKDQLIDDISLRWSASGTPREADEIKSAKDNFVPYSYDSQSNAFITLTRQFGGTYTSRKSDGKGSLDFDNATTRDMLDYFGTAARNDTFTIPSRWEGGEFTNEVSKYGTAVFSVGSTAGLRYNTPVENGYELFELGVAPIPYDRYNVNNRSVIQQGTNVSLTKSGTQAQKLASWYFIKYLTSNAIQSDFAVITGYSPIRESVYTTESYEAYLANADVIMPSAWNATGSIYKNAAEYNNAYELKVKAMGSRIATEQRNFQFFDTPFVGSSATRDAVGTAFERVILSKKDTNLTGSINDAIAFAIDEASRAIS